MIALPFSPSKLIDLAPFDLLAFQRNALAPDLRALAIAALG
jgi:hypothetical protein